MISVTFEEWEVDLVLSRIHKRVAAEITVAYSPGVPNTRITLADTQQDLHPPASSDGSELGTDNFPF